METVRLVSYEMLLKNKINYWFNEKEVLIRKQLNVYKNKSYYGSGTDYRYRYCWYGRYWLDGKGYLDKTT